MYDAATGRTGRPLLLKESATYTPKFATAILEAWEQAGPVPDTLTHLPSSCKWIMVETGHQEQEGQKNHKTTATRSRGTGSTRTTTSVKLSVCGPWEEAPEVFVTLWESLSYPNPDLGKILKLRGGGIDHV
jgi:hypothetical protein